MRKRPFYSGNIFLCGDATMIYACFGITCCSFSAQRENFEIKFLPSSNKICEKRYVCIFYIYIFKTCFLCVFVPQKWVKLAQMLQLFACSTLEHFYLPRLQRVFVAHTLAAPAPSCHASPRLVFRLSMLHMHLC